MTKVENDKYSNFAKHVFELIEEYKQQPVKIIVNKYWLEKILNIFIFEKDNMKQTLFGYDVEFSNNIKTYRFVFRGQNK